MVDYAMATKAIRYLTEEKGWADLINKKQKKKVVEDIKEGFPKINEKTLAYVLDSVLF